MINKPVSRNHVISLRRYALVTTMLILVVVTVIYTRIARSLSYLNIITTSGSSEEETIRLRATIVQSEKLKTLKDHLKVGDQYEEEPRRGDEHIIFLETSCILGVQNSSLNSNKTGLVLKARSACAIESAARTNPNRKVYLMYSCPIVGDISNSSEHVMKMFTYPNVRIWKLNVIEYLEDTPLETWNFLEKMKTSQWPIVHGSDVLRYLSLWKYGGTYLDTDFVMIKSLDDLGSNFVGAQSHNYIANGALNFRTEGVGQVVADMCIRDLQKTFDGNVWGRIGPKLVTKILSTLCGKSEIEEMTRKECSGFIVHPPEVFYEIPYNRHKLFFDIDSSSKTMERLKGSYGVHVWNKFTASMNITVGSKQPYGLLAEEFCPLVYSTCEKVF